MQNNTPYSQRLRTDRIPVSEVKNLFVKAQQLFRTFPKQDGDFSRPGISSAQLRYYLLDAWPDMHKNMGTYNAVTHEDTSMKTFKGIIKVLQLMDELQMEQMPAKDEKKKVNELHSFINKHFIHADGK